MLDRPLDLTDMREIIRDHTRAPEDALVRSLIEQAALDERDRAEVERIAAAMVRRLREDSDLGLMEVFLAEYGLSTDEGLSLMCLAEALLRVPDAETVDELIQDKIGGGDWIEHFGHSGSALVNASTLGLALTGRVLNREEAGGFLRSAARRLGEPVIRAAVTRAMKEMGRQFVLGQTIEEAADRAEKLERKGFTYSYDMLGEAAMTAHDADAFLAAYTHAIEVLAKRAKHPDTRDNPGISIKLSALHPRYEVQQSTRVMDELVPRVRDLARMAAKANMGLNIDAEEADRLDISLDVIEAVLADPELAGWDGFGVVVQSYGKRASFVIEWLHALAERLDRRIMIRLVKGAYWDMEVKRAQVEGLPGFPVFTRKAATDVSYIACARLLLNHRDRIYPQFATHNAHTVAAILNMAKGNGGPLDGFEFQRLHGMGDALHFNVRDEYQTRCRIYAPVGRHRELLAYLVRRLLENGANSSFVNQVVDEDVAPEDVVSDPFAVALRPREDIAMPDDLFAPRRNSRGYDLRDRRDLEAIKQARRPFKNHVWGEGSHEVFNPAWPDQLVGRYTPATPEDVDAAFAAARTWDAPAEERARILIAASDKLESRFGEIFALLAREAGKGMTDAIAELREAVDFLRYYAREALDLTAPPVGTVAAIAPWNFPLAIFCGEVSAGLAAGNAVLAKPAGETPLIARLAIEAFHDAGVPETALFYLPGGGDVGAAITADPRLDGIAFTGSTATAQIIARAVARNASPHVPVIAETGGLNAMIVDSTALPEQAVRDIVASAFQSAGQRCSALRILYVQEDVAPALMRMLEGAMDELVVGDPWKLSTDVGPLIGDVPRARFEEYVASAKSEGRLVKQLATPDQPGHFFPPTVLNVSGIAAMEDEMFGPILHVATYKAGGVDEVVAEIEARGYGLTFGLHTRITARSERVGERIEVGNAYVNRNQIGAVVGSQPFGGEGLSGTGPKAGGPRYVARFVRETTPENGAPQGAPVGPKTVQAAIDALPKPADKALESQDLPGPTGEHNRYTLHPRGNILCLGPTLEDARGQALQAAKKGCPEVIVAPGAALDGHLEPDVLAHVTGVAAVAWHGDEGTARALRIALADRDGPIIPLLTREDIGPMCVLERHTCTDTTAAGGNAALIAK